MPVSLYISKSDGDREMLDDVSLDMACQAFAGMNWESELAAVKVAQDAGKDVFFPEFGLADEAERSLAITIDESEAFSFTYLETIDSGSASDGFPKTEVPRLIEMFFSHDHDGFEAFAEKTKTVPSVTTRELTEAEFNDTIAKPVRRLGDEELFRPLQVRNYLSKCIADFSLPTSLDTIQLTDIFVSADKRHSHIVFDYGDHSTALVIIVRHDPDNLDSILGHHFVSLAETCYTA